MARIKNTRELVLRARGHARADHIVQGTYGDGEANGHVTFHGCAIGCLATPHRKRTLRRWIKSLTVPGWGYDDSSDDMLNRLRDEFGIVPELARVAEAVFEGLPTHGAAIEFIPAFAEALPEGADIQARHVEAWVDRVGLGGEVDEHGADLSGDSEADRDALLGWLRSRAV